MVNAQAKNDDRTTGLSVMNFDETCSADSRVGIDGSVGSLRLDPSDYRSRAMSHSGEISNCESARRGELLLCGYPLYVDDQAFDYVGEMFCATSSACKSRGW